VHFQVVSKDDNNVVISRSPEIAMPGLKVIYVYLHDNHFDLINSINGFLCRGYFCDHCDIGYAVREQHYCKHVCPECHFSNEECVPSQSKFCTDCRRSFRSDFCFRNHRSKNVCKTVFKCDSCKEYIDLTRHKKHQHKCGEIYCKTCCVWADDPATHQCYLKKLTPQVDFLLAQFKLTSY